MTAPPEPVALTLSAETVTALAEFREAQRIYEETPCLGTPVRELFRLEMAAQRAGLLLAHLVLSDSTILQQKDGPL